jgi:hypothetical protein
MNKQFTHIGLPSDLPNLKSVSHSKKRYYLSPEGTIFPSMTTVLGDLKKDVILKWRQRVGEEEANRISTQAARRGTSVHHMCEDYINNLPYLNRRLPHEIELFNSIKPILDERIDNVRCQELALWSEHLGVAGRVDCIAEFDGKLSIIDFKTSSKPKREEWIDNYFMQMAGYAIMFEERTGIPVSQVVNVIAVENGGQPQVFIQKRDDWAKPLLEAIKSYKEKYNHAQISESIRHKFDDVVPGYIAV